jgi:phosphate transport system substrate-binding protein
MTRAITAARITAIVSGVLMGCQGSSHPPTPVQVLSSIAELELSAETYPRVDGSTSTEPLQRVIACRVFDAPQEWIHSESDDSKHVIATDMYEAMSREDYHGEKKEICDFINYRTKHNGTDKAYVNLIERRTDLILVAREPSPDEQELARRQTVELDVQPIALDAFVFLLNRKNPVGDLTLAQIRDIYSGRIKNWHDVDGNNAEIHPYQRTRNSGSQELMQSLVMKERKMIKAPDMLTGTLMASPFLAIDDDVQGIGYSVYFYQEFMSPPAAVKGCAVEGVLPSSENIRNRRYPLVTEVYVVVRRDLPPDHSALKLRDWLLTPAGQSVVEESGYVPITELPTPSEGLE